MGGQPPTNPTATAGTCSAGDTVTPVNLSWAAPNNTNVVGYGIYRDSVHIIDITDYQITTYTDTPPSAGTYTYSVTALYVGAESAPALASPVTATDCASVPFVSISASPTSGIVNVVNPTITWSATNNPTSCTATGDWSGSKATGGGSQSQGVLTSVETYTYTLTCSNVTGSSAPRSAVVVVSSPAITPSPSTPPPPACTGTKPTGAGVTLSTEPEDSSKAWTYKSSGNLNTCQWVCSLGYSRLGNETKCRPTPGYEEI